jgi:hypothetical protein
MSVFVAVNEVWRYVEKYTHAVCVCTIHQNVKLMISFAKSYDLTEKGVKSYVNCLAKIICYVPSESCHYGDCEMCPGTDNPIKNINLRFQDNVGNITYRLWVTTDR